MYSRGRNMRHFGRGGFPEDPKAKERRQFKAARIIVRNLPFSSTEDSLKEHFLQFGNVAEVKLLRKGDKLVGCGFVQFYSKANAALAIQKASGKEFKGRTIIADWAVPKDVFQRAHLEAVKAEVKEEQVDDIKQDVLSDDDHQHRIKDEPESVSDSDGSEIEIKAEPDESVEGDDGSDLSSESDKMDQSDEEEISDEGGTDEEGDDSDEEGDFNKDDDSDSDVKPDISKVKKKKSNDVLEGRTVFIKNVPFMATEDELEKAVKPFGPIFFAKICVDPFTEHSKGTAFVKFKSKESADACLSSGCEFTLNGTVLDPHPALPKNEIIKKQSKPKKSTDSRNLYLLKEGVVMAGSKAAEGVSAPDMAKRLQIERWKRQIIKDLGKFVSRNRLVIHNLPPYYDDNKTTQLIKKYCPKSARFSQVRVMRDLKNVDAKGVGKSKGFAFVSFDKHEDAMATLRTLNNNPSVFKPQKRPIVSFSIESRKALKIKEVRLEKSRAPKSDNQPVIKDEENIIKIEKSAKKNSKSKDSIKAIENAKVDSCVEKQTFSGSFATPGSKKFINNLSVKKQALLHRKEMKREKTKNKLAKKKISRKVKKTLKLENMTRQKKVNKEDNDFTALVNKYRTQISENVNKKKWFE